MSLALAQGTGDRRWRGEETSDWRSLMAGAGGEEGKENWEKMVGLAAGGASMPSSALKVFMLLVAMNTTKGNDQPIVELKQCLFVT